MHMQSDTQSIYSEERILAADPIELIQILYDAAIDRVREVRLHLQEGNAMARSLAVSKTQDVLSELMLSLNHQQADAPSATLSAIYRHLQKRLTDVHIQQSADILDEIEKTLTSLSQNWRGVRALVSQGSGKVEESQSQPMTYYGPDLGPVYTADAAVQSAEAELTRSNRSWNL